ncbi:type II secretion system protein GspL [Vibrio astriarenae]|uniref:Type II secretion system protein L n=1 Tax=Vibrio astriarenae TaxID=1481923 RepID=A0A7Z2T541_9VIBR|nr:type II secretion system protein GspL [Vibrio astriarenae]QIA64497.1 type II secretion system protein GspL [Vibrio astriarenae]
MSEFLTVRLTSQPNSPVPWLVWSTQNNEVIASGELANESELETLQSYAQQRSVILLLSATDVALNRVEIPKGASRQFESMLPFLLEDELAQDVDDLHFTILSKKGDEAWVSAVALDWFEQMLEKCRTLGFDVKKVMPDVLALPTNQDGLSAVQLGNEWLVKKGSDLGAVVPSDWLALTAQSDWVKSADEYLPLQAYTPLPELSLSEGQEWHNAPAELPMQLLATQAISSKVNLLTGAFKQSSSIMKHWKVWQKAAIAAGVLLVVLMGQYVLEIQRYESQASAYRAESERIFRDLTGKSRIPTTSYLRREMESEIARLSGGAGEDSLLNWFSNLSSSLGAKPDIQMQSLRFDANRGEVRIVAQGADFQSFEKARVALAERFEVEQGPLNRNQDVVTGTFTIKAQ